MPKDAVSAMRDRDDDATNDDAQDVWSAWEVAPDDEAIDVSGAEATETLAEVIYDPNPASADARFDPSTGALDEMDAPFAELLHSLRALAGPCAPPIGEGAFDILYASPREIVVWFAPAKDGVEQREVAIPTRLARVAWEVMLRGGPVDEAALRAIAAGAAGGRWLLALFAQLPTVEVRLTPSSDDPASQAVTLIWRGSSPT